jgi:hypothetical protein
MLTAERAFIALAGAFVETGGEAGEGLQLLELGVGEAQVAGHSAVGRVLGLAAHAGNRPSDVDRGQQALAEKDRRQVKLAVGD